MNRLKQDPEDSEGLLEVNVNRDGDGEKVVTGVLTNHDSYHSYYRNE